MTTAPLRQHPSPRVPGAGRALVATLVVAGVAAGLALLVAGRSEVVGALVGAAVVAGFFLFGMVNTALAAAFAPRTALVVALLTYTVQVVGLGLLLVALTRSDESARSIDVQWLGGTVIAGALTWTVALVTDALRGSTPVATLPRAPSDLRSEGVVRR